MDFNVGDVIIVRGNGVFCQEGVPKNCDGRRAAVLKVGKKLLTVAIEGEIFSRKIRMEGDVKRRVRRGK